ncbi:hypothetical protein DM02DRAFT_653745 [Periconia macrospinosa]|uniref:Uncharacterized protein n=1 Tax=Periconia macrospinosa TaxID=97972 RepID=A0A2V1DVY4_9PLEO|nr:hypothetical protein DM02DRAFT_653745 [Periconia macrospinosa]
MAPTTSLTPPHIFTKRDGAGLDLSISAWPSILLIIAIAGFVMVMIYAIARFWVKQDDPVKELPAAQADYMREVRARNLDGLMAEAASARYRRESTRTDTQSYVSAAGLSERK